MADVNIQDKTSYLHVLDAVLWDGLFGTACPCVLTPAGIFAGCGFAACGGDATFCSFRWSSMLAVTVSSSVLCMMSSLSSLLSTVIRSSCPLCVGHNHTIFPLGRWHLDQVHANQM